VTAEWWKLETDIHGKRAQWDGVVSAFANAQGRGWLRAVCPMCEADGSRDLKKSLGFYTFSGGYSCFKCGARGRLPAEYLVQLGSLVDLDLDDVELEQRHADERRGEPAPGFVRIFEGPGLDDPAHDLVRHYVCSPKAVLLNGKPCRGIPAQRAREMQMGTGTGKCGNRVVTPIFDMARPEGPWLAWHGRDITGESLVPHLYSRGLDRARTLWNGAALFIETDDPVFICEGVLDAQAAWPRGVACLGKPVPAHLDLFRRSTRPIVVCLDGDAWREGEALVMKLRLFGLRAVNLRLPPKTDPDDVTQDYLFSRARELLRS